MRPRAERRTDASECYEMGRHRIEVRRDARGWAVSVDGLGRDQWFGSELEAWRAGITMADALDRFAGASTG
jgi:hypothetical protein